MILFYDWEVFKHDSLVVIVDPANRNEYVFANDREGFIKFYNEHKNDIWVGFNSRDYDSWITKAVIAGFDPYEMNDWIINKKRKGWEFSSILRDVQLYDFDCFTGYYGLKTLEAFQGNNIKESSVPFDIKRKLTPQELAETIEYCRTDVYETIKVFLKRKEEFDAQMALLKEFNLPMKHISKTKPNLSAYILGAKKQYRNDEFDFEIVNTLKLSKYKYIADWYKNPLNHDGSKGQNVIVASVPHLFKWGGLHGSRSNEIFEGFLVNMDVQSYYPSLMIEYGFGSRNCTKFYKFKDIYEKRLKLKAEGKKKEQAPFKIVLNSTYGAMKDEYNAMYDPRQVNNVCVNGQLLLLDLIEKVEGMCELLNTNTDGILVKLRRKEDFEKLKEICQEWQDRTRMTLEFDLYKKFIVKDVNNYILIDHNGKYKSKGAYVKQLNDLDYNLPIVNKAIVDYFTRKIPVEDTILNCNELKKFQQIVKVSGSYDYAVHGCEKLKDKTLRIFASVNVHDRGVFKVKKGNYEKFADTPLNCFINNGDINGLTCPIKLDKQYYIYLAKKRIQQFMGV